MSMISLSDLVTVLLGGLLGAWQPRANPPGGPQVVDQTGDPLSAHPDFCCPSAGTSLSAYPEYPPSVLRWCGGGQDSGESGTRTHARAQPAYRLSRAAPCPA